MGLKPFKQASDVYSFGFVLFLELLNIFLNQHLKNTFFTSFLLGNFEGRTDTVDS
jgi:hypothetical protein